MLSGSPFSSRMRWAAARSALFRQEGTVISADVQPGSFSAADRCELMATLRPRGLRQIWTPVRPLQEMPAPRHRHRGVARHLPRLQEDVHRLVSAPLP